FCAGDGAAMMKPIINASRGAAVFIRVTYSIDFAGAVCQDAIHDARDSADDFAVDPGRGCAVYLDRPTLHRQLELAAKRCRSHRAKFFAKRFSVRASAN